MARRGLLVIEALRKEFGKITALAGIDMYVDRPGVYGFLGPNGAGKTTTFRLVSGLLKPTSGRVLIDGVDVHRDARRAVSALGVQFDASPFYPYLSGRENLRVIATWLGTRAAEDRVDPLLDLVGLSDAAHRRVSGYSWGMRQRLGLASALLGDPKLLLFDEPTNGLDPRGIADVRRLLTMLAHDNGRVVLLSSHRMSEVEAVCDHVTIIHEGAIVAAGRPADLGSDDNLIEVECSNAAAAAKILDGLDDVVRVDVVRPNRMEVLAPGVRASHVNQFLIEQGVAVEQVTKRRESLERVFFRLTGAEEEASPE